MATGTQVKAASYVDKLTVNLRLPRDIPDACQFEVDGPGAVMR